MKVITQAQYWIAHTNAHKMAKVSGSFESRLGELFFKADMTNATRLVNAFPEFFQVEVKAVEPQRDIAMERRSLALGLRGR